MAGFSSLVWLGLLTLCLPFPQINKYLGGQRSRRGAGPRASAQMNFLAHQNSLQSSRRAQDMGRARLSSEKET